MRFMLVLLLLGAHDCQWWWPVDPPSRVLREKITVLGGFQCCMTRPGGKPEGCCADVYDVDRDGDVDLADYARWVVCIVNVRAAEITAGK